MKRMPAVAGQFYQGDTLSLEKEVERLVVSDVEREKVIGVISPHAGLMYSGSVAGSVYSRIELPETFIMIGPNHTGLGAQLSIMTEGEWEIPTHSFGIDNTIADSLVASNSMFSKESSAHRFEHSLEVQLPFIAHFSKNVEIVPIIVMHANLADCKMVGESISTVIQNSEKSITVVASSDMSHYVSDSNARTKDKLAIDRVLSLDPEGLYDVVKRENITMCGFMPATIMLYAALSLGATSAELVKYTTSAEVSGDYDHVVGYAGITVK